MIETCLLDMGNVLVLFSHEVMCRQIAALTSGDVAQVRRVLFEDGLQLEFERGQVTEDEFHRRYQLAVDHEIEKDALCRAGSDIFRENPGMTDLLLQLRSLGMRLVLLSNTSTSHFQWVQARFGVLDGFDDFVLSYEVGEIKPHRAMYEAAIERIGCAPANCFYTDDIAENIDAGRRVGLQAELFTSPANLGRTLASHGVALDGVA